MQLLLTALLLASPQDPLVVHEWGTFTCLQDEAGREIGGVNTDDEPVPEFVHRVVDMLYLNRSALPPLFLQGAPSCHLDATMRLETPVLYFHPPRSMELPLELDVEVGFRGGWLTEFYPAAEADMPGAGPHVFDFGPIEPNVVGALAWEGLRLSEEGAFPETDWHVWLAPRAVDAAAVTATNGESERYLFYRGVGNLRAPLSVARESDGLALAVRRANARPLAFEDLWLLDVRACGQVAWRAVDLDPESDDDPTLLARTAARFAADEYGPERLDALRADMRAALMADGLFDDEAAALLATWELSYFRSPGLRLFFLVPQAWTDAVLPLELSLDAQVVRTMVGRIELVTPEQRALLAEIAAGPLGDTRWFERYVQELGEADEMDLFQEHWRRVLDGAALEDVGLRPPADYRSYVALGRFRNALLLDEERRNPSERLSRFVEAYALQGFEPER